MDARLKYLTTIDKLKLYYEFWIPEKPKANIIFVHGLGDHIGRYGPFVRYFAERGYGVALYDQRGHGKSEGRRTHCKSFSDYLRDLAQVIDILHQDYQGVPKFIVGHSFGAVVAINFVARFSKGLRGFVAASPAIEPLVKIPKWKEKMGRWSSKWMPIARLKTAIDPEFFSHDKAVVEAVKTDPLMNWDVTARLGTEILKNLEILPKLAFQIKIPCLFMHGGEDKIASLEATRRFYYNTLIQKKELKVYQGQYHELLNEDIKEKVFKDIENWVTERLDEYSRLAKSENEVVYDENRTLDFGNHPGIHGSDIR